MALYLIKRGPKPEYYHQDIAWHPVIICDRKGVAKWEAGATDARSWVWTHSGTKGMEMSGWLLERWEGLDIDHGHVVRGMPLPDGRIATYEHPGATERPQPFAWDILFGAVWWSNRKLPEWLKDRGVLVPADEWTLHRIEEDIRYAKEVRG